MLIKAEQAKRAWLGKWARAERPYVVLVLRHGPLLNWITLKREKTEKIAIANVTIHVSHPIRGTLENI